MRVEEMVRLLTLLNGAPWNAINRQNLLVDSLANVELARRD
jgi:hypothetical protein